MHSCFLSQIQRLLFFLQLLGDKNAVSSAKGTIFDVLRFRQIIYVS